MSRRERKNEAPRAPRRTPWKAILAAAGVAAAVAIALGFLPRLVPEARRPLNVILVTADTLRADRLPVYGYDKVETPSLDRMAQTGVVFEQATTVVPLTLPAHSSMFTGTYPMHHGVRDNGGYYLGQDQVTLAETLKENGYKTGGFVAAFVLDSRWGLNQGFDHYWDDFDLNKFENVGLDTVQRRGGEVLAEAVTWMEEVKDDRFFAWLHFYDVHTPYEAPEPYLSRYHGYLGARYDGEIAYLDGLMGELFDWLEKADLEDDTLVVFIGDHGESLGQHEENTHGFFIYDATMHVPFLLKAPYRQIRPGRRIPAQVRNVDLMPTILDLVAIEPPATVQGTSLVPLLEGETEDLGLLAYSESFYPRHHYGWSELKSVRNGAFHFIDAPRPELFDVRADPSQTKNLASQRAATVKELKTALDEMVARYGVEGIDEKAPETPDPETQAQLAALGYLGGPSKIRIDPNRPLPDPKDKIGLFNLIKDAGADSSEDRIAEAMAKIDQVLAQDPDILEAHYILGNLHTKNKDLEKALAAYQEALARDPEYKSALFGLATTYQEMGRSKDAETGFRRILELDPRDNRAYYLLAKIHVDRDDFEGALGLLKQAVDIGSERAPLHNLMAECYIGMKRLEEAKKEIATALEMNSELPTAHFNLALIHEEEADVPAAISAYEKELEISPKDFRSHFNVAKLYGKAGNAPKTREHFEKAIETNDKFAIGHLYLAKFYLDSGDLDKAQELALKGIELGPDPSMAPLGHFILADVYNRQGRFGDAERELRTAQRLQSS
jgi:arylsulfatase A-like enzyme/tetratricopeptide (TPR) repeat protein